MAFPCDVWNSVLRFCTRGDFSTCIRTNKKHDLAKYAKIILYKEWVPVMVYQAVVVASFRNRSDGTFIKEAFVYQGDFFGLCINLETGKLNAFLSKTPRIDDSNRFFERRALPRNYVQKCYVFALLEIQRNELYKQTPTDLADLLCKPKWRCRISANPDTDGQ